MDGTTPQFHLMNVDRKDVRENCPGDDFAAGWGGQAALVGEKVARVQRVHDVTELDVAAVLVIGLPDAFDVPNPILLKYQIIGLQNQLLGRINEALEHCCPFEPFNYSSKRLFE